MPAMVASNIALNSASLCLADRPSVRAREKLAIMPWFSLSFWLASSREYPPDSATTRNTLG